jgi:purine catabolism regulator
MTLCIADLVSHSALKIRILAGHEGSSQRIAWAHVCELEHPWEWLDPGVLLLTNGLPLPRQGAAQADFVESLNRAGLAGMVLSQYVHAPEPTGEMLQRADELAFPILFCEGSVSLSEIIRAVAMANQSEEYARLVKTLRVYDSIRFAIARGDSLDLTLQGLSRELECELGLVDENGSVIAGGELPVPDMDDVLRNAVGTPDRERPGLIRFEHADRAFVALDLGTSKPAYLLASTQTDRLPLLSLLRHAATVIALDVERRNADRERSRRRSTETWKNFLDGRADNYGVIEALRTQNLHPDDGVRVLAVPSAGYALTRLRTHLARSGIPHLPADRPPVVSVLVPASADITSAAQVVSEEFSLGVSEPHTGVSGLTDAVRQARWALTSAQGQPGLFRYGSQVNPMLPRSLKEASDLVREVLGTLIEYDASHRSDLLKSLSVFLKQDRSWQAAADELFIHKQTLVYRMRRVEELTGRKISSSSGLSELWFALQAYDGLEGQ